MSWFWLIIIIAGVIVDIGTSNFLFVSFSMGALVAVVLALFGASAFAQFLVFAVVSVASLLFIYPRVKAKIKKDNLVTKTQEENYVGRTIVLPKDIEGQTLIKYEGVFWTFKSLDGQMNQGERAKIVGIEGNKLLVKKDK